MTGTSPCRLCSPASEATLRWGPAAPPHSQPPPPDSPHPLSEHRAQPRGQLWGPKVRWAAGGAGVCPGSPQVAVGLGQTLGLASTLPPAPPRCWASMPASGRPF